MLSSEKHFNGRGGMISRREIPSPSIFDKGKNIFQSKRKTPFDAWKKKILISQRTHTLYRFDTYCIHFLSFLLLVSPFLLLFFFSFLPFLISSSFFSPLSFSFFLFFLSRPSISFLFYLFTKGAAMNTKAK